MQISKKNTLNQKSKGELEVYLNYKQKYNGNIVKYVENFDPEAMNREIDFFDGQYIVYGHEIEKWLDVGIEIENRKLGLLYPYSYSRKKTFIAWQQKGE